MDNVIITVPTLYDGLADFDKLFDIWSQLYGKQLSVILNFQRCSFLSHNATAFLGGLIRMVQYQGGQVGVDWDINREPIKHLTKNGFSQALGLGGGQASATAIPYREDYEQDKVQIEEYLTHGWIGRGWVHVSDLLRDAIVGRTWEVYANAFEHANSQIGVFSCGQYYPHRKMLKLAVVDFGCGIPANVRPFLKDNSLSSGNAIEWALDFGNSTRTGRSGGLGLELLKEFIALNNGKLEVFSLDGYVEVTKQGVKPTVRPKGFVGTLLNISLRCDETYYLFSSETPAVFDVFK